MKKLFSFLLCSFFLTSVCHAVDTVQVKNITDQCVCFSDYGLTYDFMDCRPANAARLVEVYKTPDRLNPSVAFTLKPQETGNAPIFKVNQHGARGIAAGYPGPVNYEYSGFMRAGTIDFEHLPLFYAMVFYYKESPQDLLYRQEVVLFAPEEFAFFHSNTCQLK